MDALIALGRLEQAEEEATRLLQPGTYLEPFALRTLGHVRRDPDPIEQAVERFEALGLHWHAAQTRDQLRPPALRSLPCRALTLSRHLG